jgi:hypothetical protein
VVVSPGAASVVVVVSGAASVVVVVSGAASVVVVVSGAATSVVSVVSLPQADTINEKARMSPKRAFQFFISSFFLK